METTTTYDASAALDRGPAYRTLVCDILDLIEALPQGRADEIIEEVYGNSDEGAA